jgi:hypothetical protein
MADPLEYVAHSLGPLYIAVDRFDARKGKEWSDYVAWSGLRHVSEIVTLDSMLCERVVEEVVESDWPHIVNENFMLDYFVDLDYLLERAGSLEGKNLLCVFRNPPTRPMAPTSPVRFRFLGYDLVDVHGAASPVTNCGGFPEIFAGAELNKFGLIESIDRAREIQSDLFAKYKGENHSRTYVWGICRAAL